MIFSRKPQQDVGINVYGYVHAASGVGQHTRLLVAALESAGIASSTSAFSRTASPLDVPFPTSSPRSDFPFSIIGVNADETPHFFRETKLPENQYKIGLWAWEIEDFPASMAESASHLDEIWANSGFSAGAIARQVDKPVMAFPLPVAEPEVVALTRADFGLSDDYLFLFCFDYDSIFARKNPVGVLTAFREAFPTGHGVQLLLKSINGERHPQHRERLRDEIANTSNARLFEKRLSLEHQHTLQSLCDCYVSLHRAEGFGLTIAECMALGKPVIATAYSGNLDYMNHGISELIGARVVPIGEGAAPYSPVSFWAEPDLDQAARAMRRLVADRSYGRRLGAAARASILENHGLEARGSWIRNRLSSVLDSLS